MAAILDPTLTVGVMGQSCDTSGNSGSNSGSNSRTDRICLDYVVFLGSTRMPFAGSGMPVI